MEADPLLRRSNSIPMAAGVVDHRGRPVDRATTGSWAAALFIIGVEIAERSAYYGISLNLITYLTGDLGEDTAAAAAAVNTWAGAVQLLPLLGAFVADSYWGRYRTILAASFLYVLGLGMLTVFAIVRNVNPHFHVSFFYFSLYVVAFAQGGHKPCVQAFGADQFDENVPEEFLSRNSFFNWWYFGMNAGIMASIVSLSYVQDNVSWSLGFGIPCIIMVIALIIFLLGTKIYRYCLLEDESPFARVGRAFFTLARSWVAPSTLSTQSHNPMSGGGDLEFPDASDQSKLDEDGGLPNLQQVEEAKRLLQLFPIWAGCLMFGIVFAQSSTFFTKQGRTLDRRIGQSFEIPPAALIGVICLTVIALVPIYDRVLVPTARKISKKPEGITQLQRIGTGLVFSMLSMIVAALVEIKRLKTARDFGLIDLPNATIPMSLWWMVPQYILYGIADVFAMVGLQDFFYDQVPDALRSLGLALYLSIFGIGSFISSFLVSVIDKATAKSGNSWFSNNLNRAHLDYFYWLLAGLSAVGFIIYQLCAHAYTYKKKASRVL